MEKNRAPWCIDKWGNLIDADGRIVSVSGVSLPCYQSEAATSNTRLLSAAPELLEALESLVACISETRGSCANESLNKALAAITKAKGESK